MENELLIAQRIKSLRTGANMTQEEFGDLVGVTKHAVSRWEKGLVRNMKTEIVTALSQKFDVSPLWLMGYDTPKRELSKAGSETLTEIRNLLAEYDEGQLVKLLKFMKDFL